MSEIPLTNFPKLDYPLGDEPVHPASLMAKAQTRHIEDEMAIIRSHHEHIARGIELFWGYRDCVDYLHQLILNGGDGMSRTRVGFKHEVVEALLNLLALHETHSRK